YQAILRNPLADPYLLGASSGASLAVYMAGVSSMGFLAGFSEQAAAFAGAMVSVLIVLGLGQRRGRLEPTSLILIRGIVNAIYRAGFLLVASLNSSGDLTNASRAIQVLIGGMRTSLSHEVWLATTCVFAGGWIIQWLISGQLAIASLDESEARSLGLK